MNALGWPADDTRPFDGPRGTASPDAIAHVAAMLREQRPALVLTGAGVSCASGIPVYRDREGKWLRNAPIMHQEFVQSAAMRRRYWARSMAGWPVLARAIPNDAHHALATLERLGYVGTVITQNVDGLHQGAGSCKVIDLHGRLDAVACLDCGCQRSRHWMQVMLERLNAAGPSGIVPLPDGDAELEADLETFAVPACSSCGGVLKPDVVFYGGNVPPSRVQAALAALGASCMLLVIGSSLTTFSGYRFCLQAREEGKPIVAINAGRTRADALLDLKIDADCQETLAALVARLAP